MNLMKDTRLILLLIDYLIENMEGGTNTPSVLPNETAYQSTNTPPRRTPPSTDDIWQSLGINADQFGQEQFTVDDQPTTPSSTSPFHATQVKLPMQKTPQNTSQTSSHKTASLDKISNQPSEFDDFNFDF